MKTRLLFLCLFVGMTNLLSAQNDRNILKYSIKNPEGRVFHLTYTITSIEKSHMILHWTSSDGETGDISLASAAWKTGTRGYWNLPVPNTTMQLDDDQTIASFSQNFYADVKQYGKAEYDGITFVKDERGQNTSPIIGSQPADVIFLKSTEGDVNVRILDNPGIPLLVKAENIMPGYTIELEDAGTFFFWKDVKNFITLPVPNAYLNAKGNETSEKVNTRLFKDATEYLGDNFVRDGSVDYTQYLQDCLDANRYVLMPDFPVLINDKGLDIRDNQTICFQKKSQLLLKPSEKQHYEMLRIKNVRNVTVLNANLIGDREEHTGVGGEWGMGISITGSQNITIKNARISNCWGDGIYIGRLKKLGKNIRIENCVIDNVRRNGLSVISAVNLKVVNCVFANTNGTDPQCGVDIEPNNTKDVLRRISFENNITFNNKHSGLLIYLNESPKKDKRHKATIKIYNNFDDNSLNPIRISGFFLGNVKEFKPMKGWIKIKGLDSKDNKPNVINKNQLFPRIIME